MGDNHCDTQWFSCTSLMLLAGEQRAIEALRPDYLMSRCWEVAWAMLNCLHSFRRCGVQLSRVQAPIPSLCNGEGGQIVDRAILVVVVQWASCPRFLKRAMESVFRMLLS